MARCVRMCACGWGVAGRSPVLVQNTIITMPSNDLTRLTSDSESRPPPPARLHPRSPQYILFICFKAASLTVAIPDTSANVKQITTISYLGAYSARLLLRPTLPHPRIQSPHPCTLAPSNVSARRHWLPDDHDDVRQCGRGSTPGWLPHSVVVRRRLGVLGVRAAVLAHVAYGTRGQFARKPSTTIHCLASAVAAGLCRVLRAASTSHHLALAPPLPAAAPRSPAGATPCRRA